MRIRTFPLIMLFFICFAVGAVVGRRWVGSFADAVLSLVTWLALCLIVAQVALFVWNRIHPPNALPAPSPFSLREHLIFMRDANHWVLRVQDAGRLQFVEFKFTLPRRRAAEFTRLFEPPPPLLNVVRHAVVEKPWRAAVFVAAWLLTGFLLQQLPATPGNSEYAGLAFVWLLACGLYVVAVTPPRARSRHDWGIWRRTHGRNALLLGALTLAALFLRAWDLGEIPFVLNGDEASFGMEVLYVLNGVIRSPFTTGHLSQPTMSFFYDSLGVLLLGATTAGIRLPWAILGALTVPVTFWLVSRLKGPRVGFVAAALLTTYHFHIHYSRMNLNNIADPFWGALALLFLYRALDRRNSFDWTLAGFATAGALYFYQGARLTLVVIMAVLVYLALHERLRFWHTHRQGLLIGLGAFLILGAPIVQYALLYPDIFNARVNQASILAPGWLQREMLATGKSVVSILFDQFQHAVLAFNYYPDRSGFYGLPQPLLDPIFGALFLLGIGYGTLRIFTPGADRRLVPMVAWWWGGIILGGTLTFSPPSSQRLITLAVPTCFLIAFGLWQLVRRANQAIAGVPRSAVLVAMVLLFSLLSLKLYFVDFTPLRITGGVTAEFSTEIAPVLSGLSPKYHIYFFGAPFMYWRFPTLSFLVPNANAEDVPNPITSPPPTAWIPPGRGAVFIFVPARAGEMALVQQTFPNGEVQVFRSAQHGEVLGTMYQVPP